LDEEDVGAFKALLSRTEPGDRILRENHAEETEIRESSTNVIVGNRPDHIPMHIQIVQKVGDQLLIVCPRGDCRREAKEQRC